MYTPPFSVSAKSIRLISDISARLERYIIRMEQSGSLYLRRVNRIKTIQGSLAIEGNTFTESQITDVLEGKRVIAPRRELQEVRNAIKAYESFTSFDPFSKRDLLKAHGIMMEGLVDHPGYFRTGGVCVAGKEGIIHIAPPANRVSVLMGDLFEWLKQADDHMLVKSCVFHYEFEFIHPFDDGNGRIGRLWQSRILAEWNPVFEYVPVENLVYAHQREYYQAINRSTEESNSGIFTEFMLEIILKALDTRSSIQPDSVHDSAGFFVNDPINDPVNDPINQILSLISGKPDITYEGLAEKTGNSRATIKRKITALKKEGKLCRRGSNKTGFWEILP
ncbi:MAG: Fic family protein [Spirochaetaceae bacterium]|jgi:Fic family protein|nr:Fic family protein [Spirochaetaceae bacterium]